MWLSLMSAAAAAAAAPDFEAMRVAGKGKHSAGRRRDEAEHFLVDQRFVELMLAVG
jgi:hypothetical protein